MSKYINESLPKEKRLGQVGINNQGLEMAIIRYGGWDDIDVKFIKDGCIVENKQYTHFRIGSIVNTNVGRTRKYRTEDGGYCNSRIGETKLNNQGLEMTIIRYGKLEGQNETTIDVRFKDGVIVTNKRYSNFKKGAIAHPIRYEESLAYLYPQVAKMIAIPQNNLTLKDTEYIYPKSPESYFVQCPECEKVSNEKVILYQITSRNYYACGFCGDGFSIPEKFTANVLKQLNEEFQKHKSDFDWCMNKEYDFYLPNLSLILEAHGEQHYKEGGRGRSLKEEQANDRYKKHLAKKNGIKRYYQIDCKYVDFGYIKNNLIKSLNHLFDLSNIDWELAWEESQDSLCVKSWYIYNNLTHDIDEISKMLGLSNGTIRNYLKKGAELGKCDYSKDLSYKERNKKIGKANGKKVICLTTKRLFWSIAEANRFYKMKTHILDCCNGIRNYAGEYKGKKLVWRKINLNHNKILRGKDISKLHKINQKVA